MTKWVHFRTFPNSAVANTYLHALNEEGIPYVTGNENMSSVLPLGGGGIDFSIDVHVPVEHVERISSIFEGLDYLDNSQLDEDFSEADAEEIEYQRQLHSPKTLSPNFQVITLFLIVLMIGLAVLMFLQKG